MLVLSRTNGESITLIYRGEVLGRIKVRGVSRTKLDLDIVDDLRIVRSELIDDLPLNPSNDSQEN